MYINIKKNLIESNYTEKTKKKFETFLNIEKYKIKTILQQFMQRQFGCSLIITTPLPYFYLALGEKTKTWGGGKKTKTWDVWKNEQ